MTNPLITFNNLIIKIIHTDTTEDEECAKMNRFLALYLLMLLDSCFVSLQYVLANYKRAPKLKKEKENRRVN